MKNSKSHKRIIQAITDKLVYHITELAPEFKLDFLYSTKKLVSRYISFQTPSGKIYRIRVSDHINDNEKNEETFNHNLIIDCNKEFDAKAEAEQIVIMIEAWEFNNSKEEN